MKDEGEIPVVPAKVKWECPKCNSINTGNTHYRCFTKFAHCIECGLRVIPDTELGGLDGMDQRL